MNYLTETAFFTLQYTRRVLLKQVLFLDSSFQRFQERTAHFIYFYFIVHFYLFYFLRVRRGQTVWYYVREVFWGFKKLNQCILTVCLVAPSPIEDCHNYIRCVSTWAIMGYHITGSRFHGRRSLQNVVCFRCFSLNNAGVSVHAIESEKLCLLRVRGLYTQYAVIKHLLHTGLICVYKNWCNLTMQCVYMHVAFSKNCCFFCDVFHSFTDVIVHYDSGSG